MGFQKAGIMSFWEKGGCHVAEAYKDSKGLATRSLGVESPASAALGWVCLWIICLGSGIRAAHSPFRGLDADDCTTLTYQNLLYKSSIRAYNKNLQKVGFTIRT